MGLTDWVFFADAARVSGSTLTNLGTAGTDLDATIGGDVVAVNGPAIWQGSEIAVGNGMTAPISELQGLGRFEIVMALDVETLNSGGTGRYLFGNNGFGTAGGVLLRVIENGGINRLQGFVSDGVGSQTVTSTNGADIPEATKWIRWTLDGSTYRYYYSEDAGSGAEPSSWTELGSGITATRLPGSGTTSVGLFRYFSTGQPTLSGKFYRIIIRDEATGGDVLFELNVATDLAAIDATTITTRTGHTVTVARPTSGPVLTLVPAGESLLINPDQTDTANKITTGDDAVLDIAADESAVLAWVGVIGNQTGSFARLARVGPEAGNSIRHYRDNDTDTVGTQLRFDGTYLTATALAASTTALDAWFTIIDRDADLLRNIRVQADGTTTSSTVDISAVGALTFTEGITSLLEVPGAVQYIAYDADRLVTVAEATALGVSLLTGTTLATSGTATCTPRANTATSTARANTIEVPA